jgi:hypothetical protein
MSKFSVEIQGASPILMNRFGERSAEQISVGSGTSFQSGTKGTPREQAEPKRYLTPEGRLMIPGPNVYAALIAAGIFQKAGKKQLTTQKSSLIPAGILIDEMECSLIDPFTGKEPAWEVDSRSVVIPSTGGRVMCHRPRIDAWKLGFTLLVDDKMFGEQLVRTLVDDMGTKIGLGDFRPARKGPFGRSNVVLWERQAEKKPIVKTKAA